MAIFEMSLPELKRYEGRTPRPADFDAYWKRALDELAAVDPAVELIPTNFKAASFAECFDLYFRGVGGARIHAKYVRPARPGDGRHPALLQFHGYSMNAGDWFQLLPYAAAGMSILALDCRGQGGLSEDRGGVVGTTLRGHFIRGIDDHPDKLLFRQIFLDTVELAHIAMSLPEIDPGRIGATGASQGGGLTLACASLEPRIKLVAPVYPFLSDYQRVWEMDLAKGAYEELSEYFRRFDPRHERERELFTRLGYIDVEHLAPRIRGRVLFTVGLMDEICPPSSQFAAYNRITAPKELVVYPDFSHEQLPDLSDIIFTFMVGL